MKQIVRELTDKLTTNNILRRGKFQRSRISGVKHKQKDDDDRGKGADGKEETERGGGLSVYVREQKSLDRK